MKNANKHKFIQLLKLHSNQLICFAVMTTRTKRDKQTNKY